MRRYKLRPRELQGKILGHTICTFTSSSSNLATEPASRVGRGLATFVFRPPGCHWERGWHVSGAGRNAHAGGCVSGRRPMLSAPRPWGAVAEAAEAAGGSGSQHHVESAQEPVRGHWANPARPILAGTRLRRADAARHRQCPGRGARASTFQPHCLWA